MLGTLPHTWRDLLPDTDLVLFTIGLLAVRYRALDEPRQHVRLIAGWMIFGLLSWAASWLVLPTAPMPIAGTRAPLAAALGLVQDQWLSFPYVGAVLLLLAYRPWWTARLAVVGQAGRTALTNYMLQVMVLDYLCSPAYGVGLKLRPCAYAGARGPARRDPGGPEWRLAGALPLRGRSSDSGGRSRTAAGSR